MTTEALTTLLWLLPIMAVIQAVSTYCLVVLVVTGRRLFERRDDRERGQMRGIHDLR